MDRGQLLRLIDEQLGARRLIWSGLRADDARALRDLPQYEASFSILGASRPGVEGSGLSYEDLSGVRTDPEVWDVQDHLRSDAGSEFRRALLTALESTSALLAYRPSQMLSAVAFSRAGTCLDLNMFGSLQAAFEHKPWVETSVGRLGIPRVPWQYVAEEEIWRAREMLRQHPVMVRRSRTSGGEGLVRVDDGAELARAWPRGPEGLVSVAPFLNNAVPLNIGAVAWADGVTIHHPSVQLVGLPSCVSRPFGYCGNDFALARSLDAHVVDDVEGRTRAIGDWLRSNGYRGAFGVDYVVHEGRVLFTELNPRFQGSSHASAALAREAGEACIFLEHIAAVLGMSAPRPRPLRAMAGDASDAAHVVVHWTGPLDQEVDGQALAAAAMRRDPTAQVDVIAPPSVLVRKGAVVARILVRNGLTRTGFDLDANWLSLIDDWKATQMLPEPRRDGSVERYGRTGW